MSTWKHTIAPDDLEQLQVLVSRGSSPARVLTRARILILSAQRRSAAFIVNALGTAMDTVRRIRKRYVEEGLEAALKEKPRPGSKRLLTASEEERIVALVCGPPPKGRKRWTVRLLTDEVNRLGLASQSVSRGVILDLLHRHELKPWLKKTGASRRLRRNSSSG